MINGGVRVTKERQKIPSLFELELFQHIAKNLKKYGFDGKMALQASENFDDESHIPFITQPDVSRICNGTIGKRRNGTLINPAFISKGQLYALSLILERPISDIIFGDSQDFESFFKKQIYLALLAYEKDLYVMSSKYLTINKRDSNIANFLSMNPVYWLTSMIISIKHNAHELYDELNLTEIISFLNQKTSLKGADFEKLAFGYINDVFNDLVNGLYVEKKSELNEKFVETTKLEKRLKDAGFKRGFNKSNVGLTDEYDEFEKIMEQFLKNILETKYFAFSEQPKFKWRINDDQELEGAIDQSYFETKDIRKFTSDADAKVIEFMKREKQHIPNSVGHIYLNYDPETRQMKSKEEIEIDGRSQIIRIPVSIDGKKNGISGANLGNLDREYTIRFDVHYSCLEKISYSPARYCLAGADKVKLKNQAEYFIPFNDYQILNRLYGLKIVRDFDRQLLGIKWIHDDSINGKYYSKFILVFGAPLHIRQIESQVNSFMSLTNERKEPVSARKQNDISIYLNENDEQRFLMLTHEYMQTNELLKLADEESMVREELDIWNRELIAQIQAQLNIMWAKAIYTQTLKE